MNRESREAIEAYVRRIGLKQRLAEDSYTQNMWLAGVFGFGFGGAVFLAFMLSPAFVTLAVFSATLSIIHWVVGRRAGRRADCLIDQLHHSQVELMLDRSPSADRVRDT
jgi:hypothetical protein